MDGHDSLWLRASWTPISRLSIVTGTGLTLDGSFVCWAHGRTEGQVAGLVVTVFRENISCGKNVVFQKKKKYML